MTKGNEEIKIPKLTLEQQQIIDVALDLNNEKNLLVLGKAGTGKSFLLKNLVQQAEEKKLRGIVCAPTGIAAINLQCGAQTIHKVIHFLRNSGKRFKPDYVIIDEVSMVRADILDELESMLYLTTLVKKPFGGVKIIMIGDPGQLPPVMISESAEEEYVIDNYLSPYFFSAAAYAKSSWEIVELTTIFRQSDPSYTKLLNNIREGKNDKTVKYLNDYHFTEEPKGIFLTTTNKAADKINSIRLQGLKTDLMEFTCSAFGKIYPNEYPAPVVLGVKIGARVMVIKNIYHADGEILELVNGDSGEITNYNEETCCLIFKCDRTGKEHEVGTVTWDQTEKEYDPKLKSITEKVIASFTQYPLRLAWAITIHKSQGATIQELTIDMRYRMFAPGQLYVALSRGVSLKGLHIVGRVQRSDVITCPIINEFLRDKKTGVGIKPGGKFDEKFKIISQGPVDVVEEDLWG